MNVTRTNATMLSVINLFCKITITAHIIKMDLIVENLSNIIQLYYNNSNLKLFSKSLNMKII